MISHMLTYLIDHRLRILGRTIDHDGGNSEKDSPFLLLLGEYKSQQTYHQNEIHVSMYGGGDCLFRVKGTIDTSVILPNLGFVC